MTRRCAVCKAADADWAMQPFGPGVDLTFTVLGSHYRGFPALPVCDGCKRKAQSPLSQTATGLVTFTYRGQPYSISVHGVQSCPF